MKIITIGDSHTAGYPGFDPQEKGNIESSYQYWLQNVLEKKYLEKIEILNFGLPGDTSEGIFYRTKDFLNNNDLLKINLFIINGGGNDWGINPIDYSFTMNNLVNTCKIVRNENIKVILSSISPFGNEKIIKQLITISKELKDLIINENDVGLLYFDWFNLLYDDEIKMLKSEFNSGDNEHLNVDGYRFIGEKIFDYLEHKVLFK